MSKQTLTAIENLAAVATQAVNAYNTAGKTVAAAYRKGVERALAASASRLGAGREEQPSLLSAQAREQMLEARQKWNELVLQRIESDTNNAILVMDRVAVAATSGIDAATQQLMMIDSQAVRSFVDGVIALHMPAAQFSAQLADQLLAGAQRIEARVEEQAEGEAKVQDVVARPVRRSRKAA